MGPGMVFGVSQMVPWDSAELEHMQFVIQSPFPLPGSLLPSPPPSPGGLLGTRLFFFLLRTTLKDRPKGPPTTANRHQPPAAQRQPPTATNRQPPTATNHG